MRKTSLTLLLLTLLAGCAANSLAQDVVDAEEYAAYSALLNNRLAHSKAELFVIIGSTVSLPNDAVMRAKLPYVERYLRSVPMSALRDFEAKNQKSYPLEDLMKLPIRYNLADKREIAALFQEGGGGWQAFHTRYPNSDGIISLSRVGFNSDKSEALIYVVSSCGGLCGQRSFILMKKGKGTWKVKGSFVPVIS